MMIIVGSTVCSKLVSYSNVVFCSQSAYSVLFSSDKSEYEYRKGFTRTLYIR